MTAEEYRDRKFSFSYLWLLFNYEAIFLRFEKPDFVFCVAGNEKLNKSDKAKPIVSWGRKATGLHMERQPGCLH